MRLPIFPAVCLLLLTLVLGPAASFAASRSEEWVTKQGEKFRGAPVDVLGPFAVFVTAQKGGRKVMLRQLSEEDCVRFHQRLTGHPERAARWSHANARLTKELVNRVRCLSGNELIAPKFDELPEPEFLMLVFLSSSDRRSAQMARDLVPEYQRVRARFAREFEGVFLGIDGSEAEQNKLVRELQMPWLVEDFRQSDELEEARGHMFAEPPSLLIVTRTGVPIASSRGKTKAETERALLELEAMLSLMRPGDKRAWPERLYYYRAVRLASFKTGRADPMLVGHLLDLDSLRVSGIKTVEASIAVAADGKVTSAAVHPTDGITVEFGNVLSETLRQSAMVPAVENGQFVDGTCQLRIEL